MTFKTYLICPGFFLRKLTWINSQVKTSSIVRVNRFFFFSLQWIKHFESTSLLRQAEVYFGCGSSCVAEDERPLNPRKTATQKPLTEDTGLPLWERDTSICQGQPATSQLNVMSLDHLSVSLPLLFVQRPFRGLNFKAQDRKHTLVLTLTICFVFHLCFCSIPCRLSHTVRWQILIDGSRKSWNSSKRQTNECSKCG